MHYRLNKTPSVRAMATCKKCGEKFLVEPPNAHEVEGSDVSDVHKDEAADSLKTPAQDSEEVRAGEDQLKWYDRKGLRWMSWLFLSPMQIYARCKYAGFSLRSKKSFIVFSVLLVTVLAWIYLPELYFDLASGEKWERKAITVDYFSIPSPKIPMLITMQSEAPGKILIR